MGFLKKLKKKAKKAKEEVEEALDIPDQEDIDDTKRVLKEIKEMAESTAEFIGNVINKGLEIIDLPDAGGTDKLKVHNTLDNLVGDVTDIVTDLKLYKLPELFKDLVNSDEFKMTRELTGNMDECVTQAMDMAVKMIARINEEWNDMPDFVKSIVEEIGKEPPLEPADTSQDVQKLIDCKTAFENWDIVKLVSDGTEAFDSIRAKYDVCRVLCESIIGFCKSVIEMVDLVLDFSIEQFIDAVRNIASCLKLSEIMKQYAEEIQKVTIVIVDLLRQMFETYASLELPDMPNITEGVLDVVGDVEDGTKKLIKGAKMLF